ncbi:MAG TPA: DUF2905 family protein [Rhizomicrobium sp.]|jgi:protein-S-isoprenylcysteine O-methyltransferase Ste14|nr:DUF2905 family protein [Rhizomicrobium sp.]
MARLLVVLAILVLGAAVLAPAIAFLEPGPLPGDFSFTWNNVHIAVPVIYSLCASLGLALFYLVMKR